MVWHYKYDRGKEEKGGDRIKMRQNENEIDIC